VGSAERDHRAKRAAAIEVLQQVRGDQSAHRVRDDVDARVALAPGEARQQRRHALRRLADAAQAEPEIRAHDLARGPLSQGQREREQARPNTGPA